ncbi:energy transducer TonB [Shewanella sp. D64]|uniref:energy transducer TonB n=1 Tax=unclassified Shewanella TaxID=196818 RepID=UPI0022BA1C59|nr:MULTISPECIES: energy transducer TonB [unclassified Shewanella]MEC4726428.1 energy transducer TonB [Shewanella sp. D64]MEC4738440.1 energy transducer TonB [Shewanella sp. E94]WBJ94158.1 energy transducer TonB [Shewanella sp. MTB7]
MKFQFGLHRQFLATTLGLTLVSVSCLPVLASEFSDSYSAYLQAVTDNDDDKSLKLAGQTYRLGLEKFDKGSINLANLTLNYAGELANFTDKHEEANRLYLAVLASYRVEFGNEAIELIDPLVGAAQTSASAKEARELFYEALELTEEADNKLVHGDMLKAAFDHLSRTGLYNRKVRDFMFDAYDIYKVELPESALKRVTSAFTVASINFVEKRKTKETIMLLEEVVKQFSVLDYNHPYELRAHAYLVDLYEHEGESSKSTQHCIAIGGMRPWLGDQEQVPLYRHHPNYPKSYIRNGKEGWVQLSFIIDESGFVDEPKIIDSKGGSRFETESLKVIKKWRYAPKFVDGKAVAAPSTVQLDYTLSKS